MSRLDIELKYKKLKGYNQNDFENILFEKLNITPKLDDFNFKISFNDNSCLIKLSSSIFSKDMLLKLFIGSIVPIDNIYDSISNIEINYN